MIHAFFQEKRQSVQRRGFTLIELLLVVVIIGLSLAVIVPRAWRANVDTKYGLVRQNCSELAAFGQSWAESQIRSQSENSSARLRDYYISLLGWVAAGSRGFGGGPANWTASPAQAVTGRVPNIPETNVAGILPPEKTLRNPFNGASVLASSNNPVTSAGVVPGSLFLGIAVDGSSLYYAFIWQGTDSTTTNIFNNNTFYAGQISAFSLPGLRNGVFFARTSF